MLAEGIYDVTGARGCRAGARGVGVQGRESRSMGHGRSWATRFTTNTGSREAYFLIGSAILLHAYVLFVEDIDSLTILYFREAKLFANKLLIHIRILMLLNIHQTSFVYYITPLKLG